MMTTRAMSLVLCAGMLLGVPVGMAVARHAAAPPWVKDRYAHKLDVFSRELKLTPDQKQQVAAILQEKRKKIEGLRAEIRPRFQAIRAATNAEIRQVLLPTQQPRFEQLQAQEEARWAKWRAKSDSR